MQRAHPALTQLWMRWTGIPGLDRATFDMTRSEEGPQPATHIHLSPRRDVQIAWKMLCDSMGLPEDAPERRKMPIYLPARGPQHLAFWANMKHRELTEVDGPLEWWWRLMVMRFRGVQRASKALIAQAIVDEPELDRAVVSFRNPSLGEEGMRAKHIIVTGYRQPTHVVVSLRTKRSSRHEGLAFSLDDATFRGRFISALVDLAVTRD